MFKAVYLILTQFLLLYLQLELGNIGWVLPLAQLGALYAVLAFGRNWGAGAALFSSAVLCGLYGGSWNVLYPLANTLLALILGWWIDRHDEDVRPDFWTPGAWAGLLAGLPAIMNLLSSWVLTGRYPQQLHWVLLQSLWCTVVSAALFLLFIVLGEVQMEFLGLPRFMTRKGGHKR